MCRLWLRAIQQVAAWLLGLAGAKACLAHAFRASFRDTRPSSHCGARITCWRASQLHSTLALGRCGAQFMADHCDTEAPPTLPAETSNMMSKK